MRLQGSQFHVAGHPWVWIHQPVQRTWLPSLVREDSTCCGATKCMRHNHGAHVRQLRKATLWEPVPGRREATMLRSTLRAPGLEKVRRPQWRTSATISTEIKHIFKNALLRVSEHDISWSSVCVLSLGSSCNSRKATWLGYQWLGDQRPLTSLDYIFFKEFWLVSALNPGSMYDSEAGDKLTPGWTVSPLWTEIS